MPSGKFSALVKIKGRKEAEKICFEALMNSMQLVGGAGFIDDLEVNVLRGNPDGCNWNRRFTIYFLVIRKNRKLTQGCLRYFDSLQEAYDMQVLRNLHNKN